LRHNTGVIDLPQRLDQPLDRRNLAVERNHHRIDRQLGIAKRRRARARRAADKNSGEAKRHPRQKQSGQDEGRCERGGSDRRDQDRQCDRGTWQSRQRRERAARRAGREIGSDVAQRMSHAFADRVRSVAHDEVLQACGGGEPEARREARF